MARAPRVAGVCLLLLGAAASRADESAAPLSATQQELRQLERDRRSPGKESPGLKIDAPAIQAPGQSSLPVAPMRPLDQSELKKTKDAERSRSWLVNGVRELEKEEKEKSGEVTDVERRTQAIEKQLTGPMDQADPNYLLKRYDEQQKAKPVEARSKSVAADPLAPFLQNWLGNSPVRGQFFDRFTASKDGGNERAPDAPVGIALPGARGSPTEVQAVRDAGSRPPANPYLVDLPSSLPMAPLVPAAGDRTPATIAPLLPPPAATAASPTEPLLPTREPPKTPVLPTKPDAEKYFPQLKKF